MRVPQTIKLSECQYVGDLERRTHEAIAHGGSVLLVLDAAQAPGQEARPPMVRPWQAASIDRLMIAAANGTISLRISR